MMPGFDFRKSGRKRSTTIALDVRSIPVSRRIDGQMDLQVRAKSRHEFIATANLLVILVVGTSGY
jgi:hypothetical protein